jgi:hypothetical protein
MTVTEPIGDDNSKKRERILIRREFLEGVAIMQHDLTFNSAAPP